MIIYALTYFFPNFEPVQCPMPAFNCCFLTCIQVSQEAGKMIWYSQIIPFSSGKKNFQFVVIHIVKGFNVVNEAEVDAFFFFWNFLAFSIIQLMLPT